VVLEKLAIAEEAAEHRDFECLDETLDVMVVTVAKGVDLEEILDSDRSSADWAVEVLGESEVL